MFGSFSQKMRKRMITNYLDIKVLSCKDSLNSNFSDQVRFKNRVLGLKVVNANCQSFQKRQNYKFFHIKLTIYQFKIIETNNQIGLNYFHRSLIHQFKKKHFSSSPSNIYQITDVNRIVEYKSWENHLYTQLKMGEYFNVNFQPAQCQFTSYHSRSFALSYLGKVWGYFYNQTLLMKKIDQIENHNISSFVLKLSKLLQDSNIRNIICWSPEGDAIFIDGHDQMLQGMLAQYFNRTKISSFIRQLNLYGFKKISQKGSQMIYKHPCFIKDKINLHKMIKRKRKNKIKTQPILNVESKTQNSNLQKEKTRVKGLEQIYFRIKKENEKLTNQTSVVKNHANTLSEIKDSNFFYKLKTSGTCPQIKADNKFCNQKYYRQKQKNNQNDQQLTAESQTNQANSSKQPDNHNNNDMDDYGDSSDQLNEYMNNQMDIFKNSSGDDIEELSCHKMTMQGDREANFWKDSESGSGSGSDGDNDFK